MNVTKKNGVTGAMGRKGKDVRGLRGGLVRTDHPQKKEGTKSYLTLGKLKNSHRKVSYSKRAVNSSHYSDFEDWGCFRWETKEKDPGMTIKKIEEQRGT